MSSVSHHQLPLLTFEVCVIEPKGYGIKINGALKKTPHQNPLIFPTKQLAILYQEEFEAYQGKFPKDVLLTQQLIYTALDLIAVNKDEYVEDLVNYASTDLLLYQAHYPQDLVLRQKDCWDLYLEGAGKFLSMTFMPTFDFQTKLVDRSKLLSYLETLDDFALSGFYTAVELTHSFILGLALSERMASVSSVCEAALLHETYQQEKWGISQEALQMKERLNQELSRVDSFLSALGKGQYHEG